MEGCSSSSEGQTSCCPLQVPQTVLYSSVLALLQAS